ncbi:MAG TPA: alcohol dehydrogenase catalytic domain-containing protein [Fluviicoccus sp.]|nr:alcohol dehydrogenase catalytic domain-containing protein [Fluviicoccus sp.]
MKALVYAGPGRKVIEDRPKPEIRAPGDAIVRMLKTTLCRTDLHILKGEVRSCAPGCILGLEGVGIIDSVGDGVSSYLPGDHVLISCISSCGACFYCRRGMYSNCTTGGWLLGHRIDGTQAEYVRIPHADFSLYPVPDGENEKAVMKLGDILPAGPEIDSVHSKVAIVGCGEVGLATLLTAGFYSPAAIIMIDPDEGRLEIARRLGATATVNSTDGKAVETVKALVGCQGVDTVIKAAGAPATLALCQELAGPGRVIANLGFHARKAAMHLEQLWSQNMAVTTRLFAPGQTRKDKSGQGESTRPVTRQFTLDKILDAYDTFEKASGNRPLKIIISVPPSLTL